MAYKPTDDPVELERRRVLRRAQGRRAYLKYPGLVAARNALRCAQHPGLGAANWALHCARYPGLEKARSALYRLQYPERVKAASAIRYERNRDHINKLRRDRAARKRANYDPS